MRVDEKIALDAFRRDDEPHVRLRRDVCATCTDRVCLRVCPGSLYEIAEGGGEVRVEWSGCLECGTCLVCCPRGAIDWSYPRGGFGVSYRHG